MTITFITRNRVNCLTTLNTHIKGTSNYLAELKKTIENDSHFFLNFLYDIRDILPEININSPCSFPPAVSQTWWNLTIGFYGKHLTFLCNQFIQQNCSLIY